MVLLVSLRVLCDHAGFPSLLPRYIFICQPFQLSFQDVFLCSGDDTTIPFGAAPLLVEATCRSREGFTCSYSFIMDTAVMTYFRLACGGVKALWISSVFRLA